MQTAATNKEIFNNSTYGSSLGASSSSGYSSQSAALSSSMAQVSSATTATSSTTSSAKIYSPLNSNSKQSGYEIKIATSVSGGAPNAAGLSSNTSTPKYNGSSTNIVGYNGYASYVTGGYMSSSMEEIKYLILSFA
jgi:hypothetical protein